MYTDHFGLTAPLEGDGIARDDRIFRGESQRALETELGFALGRGDAIAVVYGPAGAGKSTLAADTLRGSITQLAIGGLTDTPQTPHELLEQLLIEFGFSPYKMSRTERRTQWRQYLGEMATTGTRVGIVVENADRLSTDVLAELEALTGPEIRGNAGANVVLTARLPIPGLDSDPRLTALRQRCRSVVEVAFLTAAETAEYLRFRLDHVGGHWDAIAEPGLDARIHAVTDGAIRMIDNIVESCLARAAHAGATVVSTALLDRVIATRPGMRLGAAALSMMAAAPGPVSSPADAAAPDPNSGESPPADGATVTAGASRATGSGSEDAAEADTETAADSSAATVTARDARTPIDGPASEQDLAADATGDAVAAAPADAPVDVPPLDARGAGAPDVDTPGAVDPRIGEPGIDEPGIEQRGIDGRPNEAPESGAATGEVPGDEPSPVAPTSDSAPAPEEPVFDIPVLDDAVDDERFDLGGEAGPERSLAGSPVIDGTADDDAGRQIGDQAAHASQADGEAPSLDAEPNLDSGLDLDDALRLDEDPGFDEELPIDGTVLDALLSLPGERAGEPSVRRLESGTAPEAGATAAAATAASVAVAAPAAVADDDANDNEGAAADDINDDEDLSEEDRQQIEMLEAFANAEALEEISESMAESIFGDASSDDAAESLRAAFDSLMGDAHERAGEADDEETPAAGGRDAAGVAGR